MTNLNIIEAITERAADHEIAARILHHVYEAEGLLVPGGITPTQLIEILDQATGTRDLKQFVSLAEKGIMGFKFESSTQGLYDVARCYYLRNQTCGHIVVLCSMPIERVQHVLRIAARKLDKFFKTQGLWQSIKE